MVYNPDIHHRRSIRLKGYDYSRAGFYFVTICTQKRQCFFGEVANGIMVLNDAGRMAEKWFWELENKFHDTKCHEYIIMPNHIHFIIQNVGADLCVCPPGERITQDDNQKGSLVDLGNLMNAEGEHIGSPLRNIIQWYKTMTTNEYIRNVKNNGWPPFPGKLWQRNYYERIIRNEAAYQQISEYIINNPNNWHKDDYHDR